MPVSENAGEALCSRLHVVKPEPIIGIGSRSLKYKDIMPSAHNRSEASQNFGEMSTGVRCLPVVWTMKAILLCTSLATKYINCKRSLSTALRVDRQLTMTLRSQRKRQASKRPHDDDVSVASGCARFSIEAESKTSTAFVKLSIDSSAR